MAGLGCFLAAGLTEWPLVSIAFASTHFSVGTSCVWGTHLNVGTSLISLVALLSSSAWRPPDVAITPFYRWPCRDEVGRFRLQVQSNVNPKVVEKWDSSNASAFQEQKTSCSCGAKTAAQDCSTVKPKPER